MSNPLKVVAGLGNPGDKHADTLHNAGFWCVDELARRAGAAFGYEKRFDAEVARIRLEGADLWLAKPQSYMNLSGQPLRGLLDYYRAETSELLVVHDEIDLPPGTVRLKCGGGHGGHNGLRDVIRHCGANFLRLRIGVGHPGSKEQVTGYVLKKAKADDRVTLDAAVDAAADAVGAVVADGLEAAMKKLHTGNR